MPKTIEIPRYSVSGILDVKRKFRTKHMMVFKCSECGRIKRIEPRRGRTPKFCGSKCRKANLARYNQKYCASPMWKAKRKERRDAKKREQENENA